jgi:murein L,D-transpeptidase YafK
MVRIFKRTPFYRVKRGYLLSLVLFVVIAFYTVSAHGTSIKQRIEKELGVPLFVLEWQGEPDYAVLVDKSQQKVMIYRSDDLTAPVRVFPCSTGENGGPKTRKNDRKTPEGIYFFIDYFLDEQLAPIYGPMALPISYPNLIDEREGRDGYGIWFHGTNKPLKSNDTNGCIALENEDIIELASFIKLFETPVVISSQIETATPDEIQEEKHLLTEIIENWRDSWQNKEIEKYMSFYYKGFTSGRKNWHQWKEYKSRLAIKNSYIKVEIDNLRLLNGNGVVMATFKQTYRAPSLYSKGTKMLYLTKNSDQWKIIGETFEGDEVRTVSPEKQAEHTLREVEDFISTWKEVWEKEDLDKYILCYDKDFQSRGMDLPAWERHRKRLNDKYLSLKIEIEDLKIDLVSDNDARAFFVQYYKADSYQDIGNKEMLLIRKGNQWKIKKEEWTPIKNRVRH